MTARPGHPNGLSRRARPWRHGTSGQPFEAYPARRTPALEPRHGGERLSLSLEAAGGLATSHSAPASAMTSTKEQPP